MDPTTAIVATILFVTGLVILYATLVRIVGPRRRLEAALGLEALGARRANGDISDEEFELARSLLGR